eukprot:TRINITY_DN11450_c1_g1_i1.p1 TRINITY_DN11450_c1_g1~~TRINITY_DN11450_c1_g1_i1.p1  ORF type:complete len:165 (+),score=30.64 TRINITY_DN11450_c1_g1_i1:54-548(+)
MQDRQQTIYHNTHLLDSLLFVFPQPYQDPVRVRDDCVALFENLQSLIPVRGHDDNTQTPLIFLAGTLPITWKATQYNIPILIKITATYPHHPPTVMVNPTPEMTIVSRHPNVDVNGTCFLPYLTSWNQSFSLVGLASVLQQAFSIVPPVRSNVSPPPYPIQFNK